MISSSIKRIVRAEGSGGVFDAICLFRLWPTGSFIADAECSEYSSVYSGLAKKTQTAAIGLVGRAYCFIQKGQYERALADLAELDSIHSKEPLSAPTTRFTDALRARANQGISATMDIKSKSGMASVENANSARSDYIHCLRSAIRSNVDDFALHAALGETQLNISPVEAISSLRAASESLDSDIRRCNKAFHGFLSPRRCVAASLYVNLWLNRMRLEEATLKDSRIYKSIWNSNESTNCLKQSIQAYKDATCMHTLSPTQLNAVLSMDVAIITQDHGFSRHCKSDEVFKNWDSEKAQAIEASMNQLSGNIMSKNKSAIDNIDKKIGKLEASDSTDVLKAKTFKQFSFNTLAGNEAVSSGTTDADLVEGSEFMSLLNQIDQVYKDIPTTNVNSEEFQRKQKDLTIQLLLQQRDRINVALGMAYSKTGQEQNALRVLNEVIERDGYFSMHRALEARGKLLQSMGETARSEADFREVYRLKALSIDIPSIDVNTQRRSF
ncbi:hypothetical protein XU18_0725 [Perkinsela sp. CCAP 1560/4]|nr:hypothetical protein XU18_2459 [Perkinsela sp. CCAP 1560/4]KNH08870.1 hypothetical protein XU18_0725 [Perkinsela sp. CCAP 1560/4]|eukprot:KNH06751.1 hypothetical protein XU18_2459 [Perkinsela sp. CCAP 1560/4]